MVCMQRWFHLHLLDICNILALQRILLTWVFLFLFDFMYFIYIVMKIKDVLNNIVKVFIMLCLSCYISLTSQMLWLRFK